VKQWTKLWEEKKANRKKALEEAQRDARFKRFEKLREEQKKPPKGNQ
jgi:hypothetical protein